MNSFKDRLEAIIKEYNIDSISRFSEEIGHKRPEKIYRLLRDEKNNPSLDIIKDIANRFVHISLDWLIMGKGDMHGYKQPDILSEENYANYSKDDSATIRDLKERIKELNEDKKELIKDKDWYKNELEQVRSKYNSCMENKISKQTNHAK